MSNMTGINLVQRFVFRGIALDITGEEGRNKFDTIRTWLKNLTLFYQKKLSAFLKNVQERNQVTLAFFVSFGEHWKVFF